MDHSATPFLQTVKHPLRYRLFLFTRLPAAFFAGLRIEEADENRCVVRIPYKWFTKNPFRSTYFACLSMAAEMSTGVLAMAHLYKRNPPVSMLVVKVESEYFKKAAGKSRFTCEDGAQIKAAIEETLRTGAGTIVRAKSVGRNDDGDIVAEFYITWSFKAKTSSSPNQSFREEGI